MDFTNLALFFLTLVMSAICTALLQRYAGLLGLMSSPSARCAHQQPTPRGGGLAIIITVCTFSQIITPAAYMSGLAIAVLLLCAVGLWDDRKHAPAAIRLITHAVVIIITLASLSPLAPFALAQNIEISGLGLAILAFIVGVWWLNLYNFMDGIDGFASSQTLFMLMSILILTNTSEHSDLTNLALITAGAVLGFLLFNWAPASIFLGDIGSTFLGYAIFVTALISTSYHVVSYWTWGILGALFITDATLTLVRRIASGQNWREAHNFHAYQHLARGLRSHRGVTLGAMWFNLLWILPLAWASTAAPTFSVLFCIAAYLPPLILFYLFGAGQPSPKRRQLITLRQALQQLNQSTNTLFESSNSQLRSRMATLLLQLFDGLIIIALALMTLHYRLNGTQNSEHFLVGAALAPLCILPSISLLRGYRCVLGYFSFADIWILTRAIAVGGALWAATLHISGLTYPRTALVLTLALSLLSLVGARLIIRSALSTLTHIVTPRRSQISKNVIVYGAGNAGRQLLLSASRRRDFSIHAFIDDSPTMQGRDINTAPVFAPNELTSLIARYEIDTVIIAIPALSAIRRRALIKWLEDFPVHVLLAPSIEELVERKVAVDDLREVAVEDLLGRTPVVAKAPLLDAAIRGRIVLVSGAGGSIGSELCRQILRSQPDKLVLFERSEHALYQIERTLQQQGLGTSTLVPILGDVREQMHIQDVIQTHKVDSFYHAAAYKHVPMVEKNIITGIENNICGTLSAARAALASNVKDFVLISTDKAVRPTNVMGASKRMAEQILQAISSQNNSCRFSIVRFGNVLGSSGSVIPLFKEQIQKGGPVTVTHSEVTRYFMTISEAASLVIQAGAMGGKGDVFLLDMGTAVKVVDLAKDMIKLSGLEPYDPITHQGDIEIQFSGLRPGEKIKEELLIGNNPEGTEHPMIMRSEEPYKPWYELQQQLDKLQQCINRRDACAASALLSQFVDGYTAADLVDPSTTQPSQPSVSTLH